MIVATMTETDFYQKLRVLSTQRLILRPMEVADVNDIFEYASDVDVAKFLRWDAHPNRECTLRYINNVLSDYADGRDGPWVIQLKTECRVVGAIHAIELDLSQRRVEVGYVLSRRYWSKGITTEALKEVIRYSFANCGLNRVQGLCKVENSASARVLEKAGMKLEGILRDYRFEKGRFWDMKVYSILRREWAEDSLCPGNQK